MTLNELRELARHAAKRTAPAEFSVSSVDSAVAEGFKSLTGSVNAFMKNRYDIYALSPSPFNLSQHQGLSNESILPIRWPKYWSFSFSISPSNEYSGLISFRIYWLDLLAVQKTQDSSPTPQFKSINSSVLSFLYGPTLTSAQDFWKNHSFDYTDLCW